MTEITADLPRIKNALEFEAAMSATRNYRYGTGVAGSVFGAVSGYLLAASQPHITIPTMAIMMATTATVYGLAFYGAVTLAVEMNSIAQPLTPQPAA